MSNLYLVDRPFAATALEFAAEDANSLVVLLQDGVYADASKLEAAGHAVYAIARDAQRRGLAARLSPAIHQIGFDQLVDLIVANKVINFA